MMQPTYWLDNQLEELAHYESLWDSTKLGCSPAELGYDIEAERQPIWADHDGCPELRLWEDGFSVL